MDHADATSKNSIDVVLKPGVMTCVCDVILAMFKLVIGGIASFLRADALCNSPITFLASAIELANMSLSLFITTVII